MSASAVFHLWPPGPSFRLGTAREPFSYAEVGATSAGPREAPAGFSSDRDASRVGRGPADWARAREAIRTGAMFDLGWVRLLAFGPLEPGAEVVFASRTYGLWSVNACRIVYVVDDEDALRGRFGFAYGTLASHAVSGEERFLATWDKTTQEISFEVYKFSRPAHPLVRFAGVFARRVQRRFSRDAIRSVAARVGGGA